MSELESEYQEALQALQVAQHHFEMADADHIELAVYRLRAAELRVDVALRELRGQAV